MPADRVQSGAQSATYFIYDEAEAGTYTLTATDWSGLPEGKLKTLLNYAYLTAGGDLDWSGFVRAFATAGGSAVPTVAVSNIRDQLVWLLSDGSEGQPPKGTPKLVVSSVSNIAVRIQTVYSAAE